MKRTYHYQVDNGLFVAEYYFRQRINENITYIDITLDDLKANIDIFSRQMWSIVSDNNKPSKTAYYTLATQSHNNSFLVQHTRTQEKLKEQICDLLNNVGEDKTCIICGEKRVNTSYLPDNMNVFMTGLPSKNKFFNRANNLQSIDVCPVCLFLSYISFLNTQKISYPFLYLSDSDEFMRYITSEIQINVASNILMPQTIKDLGNSFTDVLRGIESSKHRFSDINYIDLIFFQNAKSNYYSEFIIDKAKLSTLIRLKSHGLYKEFVDLNLFNAFLQGKSLLNYLVDESNLKLRCSRELFIKIKEELIMKDQIELVDRITTELLLENQHDLLLKKLKSCSSRRDFEEFLFEYSQDKTVYKSLNEFTELVERFYQYKTLLIANILLDKSKEVN